MDKVIYPEDIYKMIELLPDERQNPMEGEESDTCVYTSEDGEHCIAGQILTMLGLKVPDFEDYNNVSPVHQFISEAYERKFDEDAIEMLQIGQNTADSLTHIDDPLAWGNAKKDMIDFYNRQISKENE
jgi:hypothetical protein